MNRETCGSGNRHRLLALNAPLYAGTKALWLVVTLVVSVLAVAASADDARQLGPSDGTAILPPRAPCSGTLVVNHDASFESAYAWSGWSAAPEYYGAWGEAYDLGACQVVCAALWLTLAYHGWPYEGEPSTIYIWEGGITAEPGAVLFALPGVVFENLQTWPQVGQHDVAIGATVSGEFTIGFWPDWGPPPAPELYFIASDEDGADGHPWTYIAPASVYPSGWQHPNAVGAFEGCRSLGIGLYYDEPPTPVEAPTWGALKSLFR
jgi:hypothetical protein